MKLSAIIGSMLIAASVAGCSTTSTSTTTSTSSSSGSGSGSATTAPSSGSPVKVMDILDESQAANLSNPQGRAGANARVRSINTSGGLGGSGRSLQVTYCVTNLSQSGADACVQQAASDPGIVAVVGSTTALNISSGLQAAGIAEIDGTPLSLGSLQNPISFPSNAGVVTTAAAAVVALNDLHLKKIGILEAGAAQAAAVTGLTNLVLASWKAAPLGNVATVPIGASDVSSYVESAAHGVEAIVTATLPSQQQQIFAAKQQLGLTVPIITANSYWTAESLKSTPGLEGANSFSSFPTSDISAPGNVAFAKDMKAIGQASQIGTSDAATAAWIAFDMVNAASKGMTTFTKASVLNAMNHLSKYNAGGLTPNVDFTTPGPNPTFPRVRNFVYFWDKVHNGKFVSAGTGKLEPIFGNG